MRNIIFLLLLLGISSSGGSVWADIYRLEGDDETITYTDAPRDKRFQLVMKEPRTRKSPAAADTPLESRPGRKAEYAQPGPASGNTGRTLPIQGRITSPTGLRNDPIDGKLRHHNGLDIAAASGTPVKPVAPGTVIFSGWKNGYGNMVILDHHDGMTTVYAHHASNNVSVGSLVDGDTVIAHVGSSGRSTGPHLHFEAWRDGVNITADFMPGNISVPHSGFIASAPINRYLQSDGTIIFTNLR